MTTTSLVLARLIDAPDLVHGVRELPPPAFSALVRRIGVEDAGPLVAMATTEQLVAAFDEDLFANRAPGERETFDAARFATWLEVLLEAGDAVAAARFAELSLDFAIHALGELVLVLDHDALQERMGEAHDRSARRVDKAIESSLSEEIEGYLLIARRHEGWDAVLSLILALDRDHRAYLERLLDRCAAIASSYLDDLDALAETLTEAESIAEDAEAEREARRAARGYVEPRAAKAFLALARGPFTPARDPLTRAYFRELELAPADEPAGDARSRRPGGEPSTTGTRSRTARGTAERHAGTAMVPASTTPGVHASLLHAALAELEESAMPPVARSPIQDALQGLDAPTGALRMAELAYLANVLVAAGTIGGSIDGRRYTPYEASCEVLAVVERALAARGATTIEAIRAVLHDTECDRLFREAMAATSTSGVPSSSR